jgi:hypothetical protein
MGDRYFYDKNGNYTGKSSDNGPYSGGAILVAFFILYLLFSGC